MCRFHLRQGTLLCAAALSLLSCPGRFAAAKERSIRGHGAGSILGINGDFFSEGVGSYFGVFAHYGTFQFAPGDQPGVLSLMGVGVYKSANGDRLYATVVGAVDISTGAGVGTATLHGGTGRYAGSTGQAQVHAQFAPSGSFVFAFEGAIEN